jgi:hypothetical protein
VSAAPAAAPVRRLNHQPAGRLTPPRLRVVAAPKRRRGFQLYVVVCLTVLFGALGTVLWLNTALAAGSFEIHELKAELSQLEVQREVMNEDLVRLGEPHGLAARAAELGMIEVPATGYIILSDGLIVGSAAPAGVDTPADGEAETGTGTGGQTDPAAGGEE